MVTTWCSCRNSGSSPRRLPPATTAPHRDTPKEAQIPPPVDEASLHVTCSWNGRRKSRRARGIRLTSFIISPLHSSGKTWRCEPVWLKDSTNLQMEFKQPSNGRRNMEKYTRPPQTTCSCFWETNRWRTKQSAAPRYLSSFDSRGYATPWTPSTCAPCTSAWSCLLTDFLRFRGTSQTSYSCRNASTPGAKVPSREPTPRADTRSSRS